MPSPLDEVKQRAKAAGCPDPICDNCVFFNAAKAEDKNGTCEKRSGESQFRFGICLHHVLVR